MMKKNNVGIFILSHERAKDIKTVKALTKNKCAKDVYIIVDDMDSQLDEYNRLYDNVVVFDKMSVDVDTMTNKEIWSTPVYARNHIIEIAKEMGYTYCMMLDDDMSDFKIRAVVDDKLGTFAIKDFNKLIDDMVDYMNNTCIAILGFVYSTGYIGGANGPFSKKLKRDIQGAFICKVNEVPKFRGVMNEDYLISLDIGVQKKLAFSMYHTMAVTPTRMSNEGGLHDTYKQMSIYERDFYTCMAYPSTGKFSSDLVFHRVKNSTFPLIISERYKK